MELVIAAILGLLVGSVATVLVCRVLALERAVALATERDLLRRRVVDLESAASEDAQTASVLAPLRDALTRVEHQVGTLERDRQTQFGELGAKLTHVTGTTEALRAATASLAGSLNASTTRGAWGELQLRRVLELAGMLAHCDFEEQVSAPGEHEKRVRPDVLVRLPGDKCLVIDAKAPLTAFLGAQADSLAAAARTQLLASHARALRGHVDALAAKAYWSAFTATPEMVVCFVPGDSILSAALSADPALYEHAMAKHVILASPGTLLAMLRSVAFVWQQEALTANARQLLELGTELYSRLGTLGSHATKMGASLQKSVEAYNLLVGSLESRVLVTARKMRELRLAEAEVPAIPPVEIAPRPLTAAELLDALEPDAARPELPREVLTPTRSSEAGERHTA